MRFMAEYRDPRAALQLAGAVARAAIHPWTLMEVCGGQTHTIVKSGLQDLLPPTVSLVHGPGCPVCVTPVHLIDAAIAIAARPEVIFCSFGDMLRVPGTSASLLAAKSAGADVRILYSPLDALTIARRHPDREVVFFAVGFETTAPANAMTVWQAARGGVTNLSLLVSHVLVPPAIEAILSSPSCRIDAFLAAGHVCAVMGYREYEPLARRHGVPIVVTGFEPVDILQGVLMAVRQLEEGRAEVENQYARAVRSEGNLRARELIREVFEIGPRSWRGIGEIPGSGLRLRGPYAAFDALGRFGLDEGIQAPGAIGPGAGPAASGGEGAAGGCIAGLILQGLKKPSECPSFGRRCTPDSPLGAPMVSSEGACAAYHLYGGRRGD
jgi:hydrogenase expression/formation protein HypD